MRQPNVTVYGSRSCSDTQRAVAFLDGRQIPYEFRDVDETPEYNDYIAFMNGGKRVTPTVRINNETLINPGLDEMTAVIEKTSPVGEPK